MEKSNINILSEQEEALLLKRFNDRDELALGDVYDIYYRELNYFVNQIYRDTTVQGEDVVHDIFLKIWERRNLRFNRLENIKAYIYTSIKNGFSDWLSHNKCVDRYNNSIVVRDVSFVTEMVESETMSILSLAIKLLPKDIADVFRLVADGWDMKDISNELNISKSSAYAKKTEAINILKNKLPQNLYSILLTISNL